MKRGQETKISRSFPTDPSEKWLARGLLGTKGRIKRFILRESKKLFMVVISDTPEL